jgi:hypothetical protein
MALFRRPFKQYTKPGRLADVLALIQVLGLDEHAHRSESGLLRELQGAPDSASSWTSLASAHREFFRVEADGEHVVSLIARHVTPKNSNGIRDVTPEFVGRLLDSAIELHDRQVRRDDRWAFWVPVVVAMIAGLFSIVAAAIKQYLS